MQTAGQANATDLARGQFGVEFDETARAELKQRAAYEQISYARHISTTIYVAHSYLLAT